MLSSQGSMESLVSHKSASEKEDKPALPPKPSASVIARRQRQHFEGLQRTLDMALCSHSEEPGDETEADPCGATSPIKTPRRMISFAQDKREEKEDLKKDSACDMASPRVPLRRALALVNGNSPRPEQSKHVVMRSKTLTAPSSRPQSTYV